MSLPLQDVLADYAKAEPKRAVGGLYALAGFDFQLRLYIAQLAESLARSGDGLKRAGEVFVEALSDLAQQHDDALVCIQAKRTLNRAALKSAAAEVIAIDGFFARHHPEMREQVRFELVGAQGDGTLGWDDLPEPERTQLAAVRQAGRLLPPRIEPDPMWRAIVAVWQVLDDPYEFVRFALDRALSRSPSPSDADRVRDDICDHYAKGRRGNTLPGDLLTPDHFTLNDRPSPRLEVGRAVTLARVRDAQYMPRPGRRDELAAKLEERHDLAHRDLQSAARVFWISGRSGVGKSVLMVQVMERLVREGRRVLWLGSRVEGLEPTLRALAGQDERLWPEFIAVDDLYDRSARTRLDLAGLGDFIDAAGPRPWPVILTCGPAEFADSFQEESRYRGFDLHRETVHPVAADESQRLADWYRGRTGRSPVSGPAFAQAGQGDGLFISLAVELEHGRLEEFAQRFADRIRLNRLDEALRLPLALNRLYLVAPYEWLNDEAREGLATLNQEGDFSLDPGEPGQAIRLTHPHLGDALYRALRKPANPTAFAHDLALAFRRALEEGRLSLADQMLRVFGARQEGLAGERLTGVDDDTLAGRCADAWLDHPNTLTPDPEAAARIAASWACWATTQPRVAARLGDDLLAQAIVALDGSVRAWSFEWQLLWRHHPTEPRLLDWAATHLPEESRVRHPAWSFVWETAHQATPARPEWRTLGLDWLARPTRRPDWHFVWKRLLPPAPVATWEGDPVLRLGERRLAQGNDGPDWAYVLEGLLERAAGHPEPARRLAAQGWGWLPGREERAEWSYVWRALLEQADHLPASIPLADLLALGWGWLPGREERADWNYVWKALLAQADHLPASIPLADLLALGWGWLPGREERAEWTHVWQALLAQTDHLPTSIPLAGLLALGWGWLPGREEQPDWNYVWKVLLAQAAHLPASIPLADLLALGWGWLPGREERAEWAHIWQALLVQAEHLPVSIPFDDLIALGRGWLPDRGNRSEWSFIWQAVYKSTPATASTEKAALIESAWCWLREQRSATDWPVIWWELAHVADRDAIHRAELIESGIEWLSGHHHLAAREASRFVEGLLDLDSETPRGIALAGQWLCSSMQEKPWPIIAAKFVRAAPYDPVAATLADELTRRIRACPNGSNIHRVAPIIEGLRCQGEELPPSVEGLRTALAERASVPAWAHALALKASGDPVRGRVVVISRAVCTVELEIGLLAVLPITPSFRPKVGRWERLMVTQVRPHEGKVSVRLHDPASRPAQESIPEGTVIEGVVSGIQPYGLFVRIGNHSGLVHNSRLTDPAAFRAQFPVGAAVRVRVLRHKSNGIELAPAETTAARPNRDPPAPEQIEVGGHYPGIVSGVQPYGLFVAFCNRVGLIRRNTMPPDLDFATRYPLGSRLWVQVERIENGRIALRLAAQGPDSPESPATNLPPLE